MNTNCVDLVIRGGTVVNAGGTALADVGILRERVVQIGGELEGREEIFAHGQFILPGGVDVHVHLSPARWSPEAEFNWVDDFYSGSRAAIAGGVTTIGNMTFPWDGQSLEGAVARDLASASANASIDYFLHPVLTEPDEVSLVALEAMARRGIRTVKLFMTNQSFDARIDDFMKALEVAARCGILVMIHCEDGPVLRAIARRLESIGRSDVTQWARSRPDFAEASSIHRAMGMCLATGASVYAVHVSSEIALDACRSAKRAGLPFFVETRPMYLHLTSELLEATDGAKYIGAPPLRQPHDVEALWVALNDGTIDTVATDHAPWSLQAKLDPRLNVRTARQGVADLETSLPLLFSEGVRTGRLSLTRFVELVSARPAQLFGLWPRKGLIAPGSDADLVLWDPEYRYVIDGSRSYSRADYSVYEGTEVIGAPMTTISRGVVVMRDRQVIGERGRGMWLAARPHETQGVVR